MNVIDVSKRVDVNYQDNKPPHTIYINKDESTLIAIEYNTDVTNQGMEQISRCVVESINIAKKEGIAILSLPNEVNLNIIKLK